MNALLQGLYRRLMVLYPAEFRAAHEAEVLEAVRLRSRQARGPASILFWCVAFGDLLLNATMARVGGTAKAAQRALWNGVRLGDTLRRLGQVVRGLARAPAFTVSALLTLVVGMGANTLMFGVLNTVVLRPLPFDASHRLVSITRSLGDEADRELAPWAVLRLRDRIPGLDGLAWTFDPESMALVGSTEPQEVRGQKVSTSFFQVLGSSAAMGRTFRPGEDEPGADAVVVLSNDFWRSAFAADPSVLGTELSIDGTPREVIGVMPPGFRNELAEPVALWIPRVFDPASGNFEGWNSETVIGRRAPSTPLPTLQEQLDVFASAVAEEAPERYSETEFRARPLREAIVSDVRARLLLMQAIAVIVLLTACANLMNLLLARANRLRPDVAVRQALGANDLQLLGHRLGEALVLTVAGGSLALLAAQAGLSMLRRLDVSLFPRASELALDGTAIALTGAVCAVVMVVATVVPSLGGERPAEAGLRRDRGPGGGLFRATMITTQSAAVMLLLVAASVVSDHFIGLLGVDPGFDAEDRWVVGLTVPATRYPTAPEIQTFLSDVRTRVASLPGIDAVAGAATLPLTGQGITIPAPFPEGEPPAGPTVTRPRTGWNAVSPGYFDAMGIPVLEGREFRAADDAHTAPVLIINRTLADMLFGTEPAVDRILDTGGALQWRVVGVVGDVQHDALGEAPRPEMYQPTRQITFAWPSMDLVLVTPGYPGLAADVRSAIWAVDPGQPVRSIQPLETVVDDSLAEQRTVVWLVGAFAGTALILALLGIYGVVSFVTSARTRELGIRVALGAGRQGVEALVVRGAALPLFLGIGLGVAGGWIAVRTIVPGALPSASPHPGLLVSVSLVLALVGIVAAWIPAHRVTGTDLLSSIRER